MDCLLQTKTKKRISGRNRQTNLAGRGNSEGWPVPAAYEHGGDDARIIRCGSRFDIWTLCRPAGLGSCWMVNPIRDSPSPR